MPRHYTSLSFADVFPGRNHITSGFIPGDATRIRARLRNVNDGTELPCTVKETNAYISFTATYYGTGRLEVKYLKEPNKYVITKCYAPFQKRDWKLIHSFETECHIPDEWDTLCDLAVAVRDLVKTGAGSFYRFIRRK